MESLEVMAIPSFHIGFLARFEMPSRGTACRRRVRDDGDEMIDARLYLMGVPLQLTMPVQAWWLLRDP